MSVQIEIPPRFNGFNEEQFKQLYSYLFRLSENLNVALNNLDSMTANPTVAQQTTGAALAPSASGTNDTAQSNAYSELRSLIVNTANIINSEMDLIETNMKSNYVSQSDWGTYTKSIEKTVSETATTATAAYAYAETVNTTFGNYKTETEGYIRSGFITTDDDKPILGIAIGQNLQATQVEIDGRVYEQINENQNCAFYTADKVSFRMNGVEVASISNKALEIQDAYITGSIEMGGNWTVSSNNGYTIKWIGGEVKWQ